MCLLTLVNARVCGFSFPDGKLLWYTSAELFGRPVSVDIDSNDRILVADNYLNRIAILSSPTSKDYFGGEEEVFVVKELLHWVSLEKPTAVRIHPTNGRVYVVMNSNSLALL